MIGMMTATTNVFKPHSWQIKPWRDKSFILLLDGSAGGGKSHLAANKIDAYMRKYPGATGLIVRKTRESMTNSTLLFFNTQVIANDPNVEWKKQDKRFEYANGSVLAYGGMKDDSQRESIRSIGQKGGLDIVWIEEAHQLTLADFEELLPRMRGTAAKWRQVILTTNPDSEQHWIYQRLILGGQAKRYVSSATDNASNPTDYVENVLDQLTGVRKLRLKDGLWVSAEGAVYPDYRYETHVIEEMPKGWERWQKFRAIDFGFTNPFVCQWWAVDGDGRMYMYREIYMSHRNVNDHARLINELSQDETIDFSVTDHDAGERDILRTAGIPTIPAQKDITVGIEKTQVRFRDAGDGKPRIFFLQGCTHEIDTRLSDTKRPTGTVEELSGYVYPQGVDGKPNKEHPIKDNDHGMDAMRYAVMAVDGKGSQKMKRNEVNPFFR